MNNKKKMISQDTILPVQIRQGHYSALLHAEAILVDASAAADALRGLLLRSDEFSTDGGAGMFGIFDAAISRALAEVEGVTRAIYLQMEEAVQ